MKNKPTTNHDQNPDQTELYRIGGAAAYIAIRARNSNGWTQYLHSLANCWKRDEIMTHLHEVAERGGAAMLEHDAARAAQDAAEQEAERYERIAAAITTTPEAREEAAAAAAAFRAVAAHHAARAEAAGGQAEDIARIISTGTTSDRLDVVHAAIVAYMEQAQARDMTQEPERDAAFYAAIQAAGRHITLQAAAKGTQQCTTKVEKVVDTLRKQQPRPTTQAAQEQQEKALEQAAEKALQAWESVYGIGGKEPFAVRGAATAGYITMERRATKRYNGIYKVYHYKTINIRPLDEAVNLEAVGGLVADVDEVIPRAGLTDRQREIVRLLASTDPVLYDSLDAQTAAAVDRINRAGVEAVSAHQQETAQRVAAAPTQSRRKRIERERARQLDSVRAAAKTAAAIREIVPGATPAQVADIKRGIKGKLQKALDHKPASQTASSSQTAPAPVVHITVTTSPDTRSAAARAYGREYATMGIRWIDLPAQPCTVIPQTRAAQDLPRTGRAGVTDPATRRKYAAEQQTAAAKSADIASRAAAHAAAGRATQAADMAAYAADLHSRACTLAALLAIGTPDEPTADAAAAAARRAAADAAAKFDALVARLEQRQREQDAARAAAARAQEQEQERRKAAYNSTLRAALHDMGTTWTAATPEQRATATAAARAAQDAVTD